VRFIGQAGVEEKQRIDYEAFKKRKKGPARGTKKKSTT